MNLSKAFRSSLIAASVLLVAAGAQAEIRTANQNPFQLAQAQTTTTTTPEGNTTVTETVPAAPAATAPPAVAPPVTAPAETTTQVEIRNEAPAAQQPAAAAPNINIDMPEAPDVNVTVPGNSDSGGTNTVTERTDRVIYADNDNDAAENSNFTLMAMLFGFLAIALVGFGIYMATRRRRVEII